MDSAHIRIVAAACALSAGGLFIATPASAQATRTWVSGVGDDVNPCSRTAPCKTFAGAISKTAAGGMINCLDPGGFGAVTITKAMTISCPYTEGGALAGGNGITVNAGPTDVVFLRGLDIFGVNPPSNGVRFIAGGALHIEDSTIRRFNSPTSYGVSFQPSGNSILTISNTTIADNGASGSGGGILVKPTGSGTAKVYLNRISAKTNANAGIEVNTTGSTGQGATVLITSSKIVGNPTGVSVTAPSGSAGANVMIDTSDIALGTASAIVASGPGARVQLRGNTLYGNGSENSARNGGSIGQ